MAELMTGGSLRGEGEEYHGMEIGWNWRVVSIRFDGMRYPSLQVRCSTGLWEDTQRDVHYFDEHLRIGMGLRAQDMTKQMAMVLLDVRK